MYKKVLVPLDGSSMAECTLDHVRRLSRSGAIKELVLLQVVESPAKSPWAAGCVSLTEQLEAEFEEHAKDYLSSVWARLASEGIKSKTEVVANTSAASAIVEYAKGNNIDLIILSSQGHSGVMHWVFGSVALKVLHDTDVPVLLIRPARDEDPVEPF